MSFKKNETWFYRNEGTGSSNITQSEGWFGTAAFLGFAAAFATIVGVIGSIAEMNPMWLLLILSWLPTLLMIVPALTHVTESMNDNQRKVWIKSRQYARELPKGTIPEIPVDVILNTEHHDLSKISNMLDDVRQAHIENTKAIRIQDHRVEDIKAALKDKKDYLTEHTAELKKMGELR